MRQPNSIVVLQTAFLGDLILLSSLFRLIRLRFPEIRIVAVLSPTGKDLFAKNPWGVEIIVFDKRGEDKGLRGWWRMRNRLRAEKFDWCLSLHRYLRTSFLSLFSGASQVFGFRQAFGSSFFDSSSDRDKFLYEAEKYLSVFQVALSANEMDPVQVATSDLYPELSLQEKDKTEAADALVAFSNSNYIIISPSSVWATKCWPVERYIDVAKSLYQKGHNLLFVGGNGVEDQRISKAIDSGLQSELADSSEQSNRMANLIGETSIPALRGLIAGADLVICNDSAPLHFATAFDRPTVSIFGPTTKSLGFFPLSKSAKNVVIEKRLDCRPCGLHGHKTCPLRHFHCMLDIEVSKVLHAVESILCP